MKKNKRITHVALGGSFPSVRLIETEETDEDYQKRMKIKVNESAIRVIVLIAIFVIGYLIQLLGK